MKPIISVIVPTHNEELNIGRCLKSIKQASGPPTEILVVDNNSYDKTTVIARQFTPKIYQLAGERSKQRNFGAKKSIGRYFLFLDADMEIGKGVLNECLALAKQGMRAIVISEKVIGKNFWGRCRALEKSCYLGDETIEAVRFIGAKLFLIVNGYDEKLIAAEDWDLTQRIKMSGAKIGHTKQFVIHHEKETHLGQKFCKKYYYGQNISLYLKKHPQIARHQLFPIRPALVFHLPKLLTHPLLFTGLVILKTTEFLGVGLGYLKSKIL